ncbi:MAG TPA: hypothetical protein VIU40_08510 [Geobacteraceae bacterium]
MTVEGGDTPNRMVQHEGIAWCLSGWGALLVYLGLALLVDRYDQPDISAARELAGRLSVVSPANFAPEPKERMLFLLGVVVLPLVFVAFYWPCKKVLASFSPARVARLFPAVLGTSLLAVIAVGCAGFLADNPFHLEVLNSQDELARTNLQFYLRSTFLAAHPALFSLVLFPLIATLLWAGDRVERRLPPWVEQAGRWFSYGWCAVLVVLIQLVNTFRFPYTYPNKYDFSAVYYPMVQVFGGVPLLVDGFTTTYGLYPHFLVPVFRLTGLSVATFSGVMALLTSISFVLLFLFLRRQLRNTGILVCCFSAIVFYSHFYFKIVTPFDSVFASQPIRFLFPMTSLSLGTLYLVRRTGRVRTCSLLLLAAGILWNPEFGTLTYAAFVVFLLAIEFTAGKRTHLLRGMLAHLAAAFLCVVVVFSCYVLTIRACYGAFPELAQMFSSYRVFAGLGLNMLPMPLLHPWNLLALVFFLGLATCLVAVVNGTATPRHALVLLVTLHGIGALMYYQGRSHNWTLLGATTYAFILMAFFAESLRDAARVERWYLVPWALLVFVLSGSACQLAYASADIAALVTEDANKAQNLPEEREIYENARFIRANTEENERVLIITRDYYQSYYYGLSQTVAAVNPGLLDLFWREDYNRIIRFLAFNKGCKVFYEPEAFEFSDRMIHDVLANEYTVRSTNGQVQLLEPRE